MIIRLKKKIWKDIKGYEGYYQVSNTGFIRSVDRWITYKNGSKHFLKGEPLKGRPDRDGYLIIGLAKEGKQRYIGIHRLVAEAFIPNPNNLPQVNHKDENKTNNSVWNLEWCTSKYNVNYGTGNSRRSKTHKGRPGKRGKDNPKSKPIRCIETEQPFPSITDAKKWLGKGDIGYALRTGGTAGGYHWEYI